MRMFLIIVATVAGACTTIPKPAERVILPIPVEQRFKDCRSGDGAKKLSAIDLSSDQLIGAADLDWIVSHRGLKLDFQDAAGLRLVLFEYDSDAQQIRMQPDHPQWSKRIKINSKGFIEVDDMQIAIKPQELSCFFQAKIPFEFGAKVYNFERKQHGDHTVFKFSGGDEERQFESEIIFADQWQPYRQCTTLTWQHFFGLMNRSVVICQYGNQLSSGDLTALSAFKLTWVDIGDASDHE